METIMWEESVSLSTCVNKRINLAQVHKISHAFTQGTSQACL